MKIQILFISVVELFHYWSDFFSSAWAVAPRTARVTFTGKYTFLFFIKKFKIFQNYETFFGKARKTLESNEQWMNKAEFQYVLQNRLLHCFWFYRKSCQICQSKVNQFGTYVGTRFCSPVKSLSNSMTHHTCPKKGKQIHLRFTQVNFVKVQTNL